MKKASELLEESAAPFDEECMIVRDMEINYYNICKAVKEVMSHMRDPKKGVLRLGIRDTDDSRKALDVLFRMIEK